MELDTSERNFIGSLSSSQKLFIVVQVDITADEVSDMR